MKRKGAVKILIGIPLYEPDQRFLDSLSSFLEELKKDSQHYKVQVLSVPNTVETPDLVTKQNYIADYFLKCDFDYLLFIENDHWGFDLKMLKALLRANAPICAMKYYSRHFPYYTCNMKRQPQDLVPKDHKGPLYFHMDNKSGYADIDLCGWGMTLIRRDVFDKLDKPYFRLNPCTDPNSFATDVDFALRTTEASIRKVGCFEYTLNHADLTEETRFDTMRRNFLTYNKRVMEDKYRDKIKEMENEFIAGHSS